MNSTDESPPKVQDFIKLWDIAPLLSAAAVGAISPQLMRSQAESACYFYLMNLGVSLEGPPEVGHLGAGPLRGSLAAPYSGRPQIIGTARRTPPPVGGEPYVPLTLARSARYFGMCSKFDLRKFFLSGDTRVLSRI